MLVFFACGAIFGRQHSSCFSSAHDDFEDAAVKPRARALKPIDANAINTTLETGALSNSRRLLREQAERRHMAFIEQLIEKAAERAAEISAETVAKKIVEKAEEKAAERAAEIAAAEKLAAEIAAAEMAVEKLVAKAVAEKAAAAERIVAEKATAPVGGSPPHQAAKSKALPGTSLDAAGNHATDNNANQLTPLSTGRELDEGSDSKNDVSLADRTALASILFTPLPPEPAPCRLVVAMSLFSLEEDGRVPPLYADGLLQGILLVRQTLPGWCTRLYTSENLAPYLALTVERLGVQIVRFPFDPDNWDIGTFWRFLIADDPDVEVFMVRDSDSRIADLDVAGIRAFLASERAFYSMHDNSQHIVPIMAGMWGARRAALTMLMNGQSMQELCTRWTASQMPVNFKGMDQEFLDEVVWPLVQNDTFNLVRPSEHPRLCFNAKECVPASEPLFPPRMPIPWRGPGAWDFVGRMNLPNESFVCKPVAEARATARLAATDDQDARNLNDVVPAPVACTIMEHYDWHKAYCEVTGVAVDLNKFY